MNYFYTELIPIYAKKAFIKCSLFDIGEKFSTGITSPLDTIPNALDSKAQVTAQSINHASKSSA